MANEKTVSIILPAANERSLITGTLVHLASLGADEIVVVDGGSVDGTVEAVEKEFRSVRCLRAPWKHRARQMNWGAREARSEILLFVHADMRLPERALGLIRGKIEAGFAGGGFRKYYEPSNFLLAGYASVLNTFYLSWMKCLVGTNAIFVRKDVFEKTGGFPERAFLEDVAFSECLKQFGKVAVIFEPVYVSSRKYLSCGVLKQIFQNARILLGHKLFHEEPEILLERYQNERR